MTDKILLAVTGFDPSVWRTALQEHAPQRLVVTEPDGPNDPDITYALVWKQKPGLLAGLPNLKAIFSIGAGVDHVFANDTPPDVPIVRVVASDLTQRMSEYVVWQVLDHHRLGPAYRRKQAQRLWSENTRQPAAADITVGIMGLGVLGADAAQKLNVLGFNVCGWSRTKKQVDGVACYAGNDGLTDFLAKVDIVVCLLPLTDGTRGILCRDLFAKMKDQGPLGAPVLINAGRGGLQVETDIVEALENGVLGGASLDVFETEPLPPTSPLWDHPNVTITPHAAAVSNPHALVPPMIAQMDAHDRGEPLINLVDRRSGY